MENGRVIKIQTHSSTSKEWQGGGWCGGIEVTGIWGEDRGEEVEFVGEKQARHDEENSGVTLTALSHTFLAQRPTRVSVQRHFWPGGLQTPATAYACTHLIPARHLHV